ncbi:MAG: 30S ribosomal protein S4, partial [Candidatus Omnitrophota bacterium]|nr:30S ribosomal protein S4 [Candidatus Omnitrophota bacterium]
LSKDRTVPSWLEFSAAEMKGKVLRLPEKTDIQQPIQEQLIVELYSK